VTDEAAFALPGGMTLRALQASGAGPVKQRVLFLHGFPEGAFIWAPLLARLPAGVQATAPWQRGYAPSSAPAEVGAYRASALVGDLVALIKQWGAPLDLLVAHDWGGAVAWNLAASHPGLLRHLLIINAPHPVALLRELQRSAEQRAASAYMADLCADGAEAALARDDWAPLLAFFGGPVKAPWLDEAARQRYRQQWRSGLQGALNWYRASPLRPAADGAAPPDVVLPRAITHVSVPTTVLWGEQDVALRPGLVAGLEQWVPALRLVRLPQCSHWVVHEAPEVVLAEMLRALGR
jgi:epoxide hydrolase 4